MFTIKTIISIYKLDNFHRIIDEFLVPGHFPERNLIKTLVIFLLLFYSYFDISTFSPFFCYNSSNGLMSVHVYFWIEI